MKAEYIRFWNNSVMHSRKQEFYQKIKAIGYNAEPYLEKIRFFNQRRNLKKFGISNHNLAIESGRYSKTSIDNRVCLFCPLNVIETEEHMALNCSLYSLRLRFEEI